MSDSRTLNPANDFLELQNIEKESENRFFQELALLIEKYGESVLQDLQNVA